MCNKVTQLILPSPVYTFKSPFNNIIEEFQSWWILPQIFVKKVERKILNWFKKVDQIKTSENYPKFWIVILESKTQTRLVMDRFHLLKVS